MVIPTPSRCTRPLKRSTRPLVCGVYGLVLRCSTFSWRQASSKPSAVKQDPRSVSTCVTLNGNARTASFRKATAVEMRQKVRDHEGEVIQGKAGGLAQGADDRPLLVRGLPGQLVRPAAMVLAVLGPAFAPLADSLGA